MLDKNLFPAGLAVMSAALMFGGSIPTAFAGSEAAIDGVTASGLCATSYPGTSGPDQLSSCQWDMRVINSGAAHANRRRVPA